MERKKILDAIKRWGDEMMIDPYIYDVLTDGSSYAKTWMNQLEDSENERELWDAVQTIFCTR